MIVVILLTIATGAVLLWALYTEQVPPPRSRGPRWTGLPDPGDIQRRDFPLAVAGYDPRAVDAHLRAVAAAFTTLRAQVPDPVAVEAPAEARVTDAPWVDASLVKTPVEEAPAVEAQAAAPAAETSPHMAFAPPPPGPSDPSPPSVPPPPSGEPPPAEGRGWER